MERRPPRGRRRHTMVVEPLVPPDAARGATVYTNAPKRRRGAISTDLCTLPWPPTAAHATGRGYGSHDIDDPMVPVMPWGSDLRPRHQGGDGNHLHELTNLASPHLGNLGRVVSLAIRDVRTPQEPAFSGDYLNISDHNIIVTPHNHVAALLGDATRHK